MTDRERLTVLLLEGHKKHLFYDKIADYLLANGVIVPPCKVGDTVYVIDEHNLQVNECEVTRMELDHNSKLVIVYEKKSFRGRRYGCTVDYIGKTVFLTKEEAEEKLEELNNGTT